MLPLCVAQYETSILQDTIRSVLFFVAASDVGRRERGLCHYTLCFVFFKCFQRKSLNRILWLSPTINMVGHFWPFHIYTLLAFYRFLETISHCHLSGSLPQNHVLQMCSLHQDLSTSTNWGVCFFCVVPTHIAFSTRNLTFISSYMHPLVQAAHTKSIVPKCQLRDFQT